MALIVMAAVWKQISYNFLFFLAGLQSIPKSLIEAAAIDGAAALAALLDDRQFPLLSPTTFFLLVINIVYAFFDTFAHRRRGHPGRPGQGHRDPGLQGLLRRLQGARPGRLGGAVGGADGDRRRADGACSSASSRRRCTTDGPTHGRAPPRRSTSSRTLVLVARRADRRLPGLRHLRRLDAHRAGDRRRRRCRCCPATNMLENYRPALFGGETGAGADARRWRR